MGVQYTPLSAVKEMDKKKYILVKNHVREIQAVNDVQSKVISTQQYVNEEHKEENIKEKSKGLDNSYDHEIGVSEICAKDIDELRTVYNKCKAVIQKIETKYGHLLPLNEEIIRENRKRRRSEECQCTFKAKILYDDDGKQVYRNTSQKYHICPNSQKTYANSICNQQNANDYIEQQSSIELPDNIQELTELLKKPQLNNNLRKQVVERIIYIRRENLDTIKYDKPYLISKLKSNPDDILEFKGANLSSLEGYPVNKSDVT